MGTPGFVGFLIILQLHKHSLSGEEATLLEAEVRLETVNLFSREVCDDLVAAGTESLARDEEKEGAELGVRGLAPWVPAAVWPPDENGALLLTLSEELLPAGVAVTRTREAAVARTFFLLSSVPPVVLLSVD